MSVCTFFLLVMFLFLCFHPPVVIEKVKSGIDSSFFHVYFFVAVCLFVRFYSCLYFFPLSPVSFSLFSSTGCHTEGKSGTDSSLFHVYFFVAVCLSFAPMSVFLFRHQFLVSVLVDFSSLQSGQVAQTLPSIRSIPHRLCLSSSVSMSICIFCSDSISFSLFFRLQCCHYGRGRWHRSFPLSCVFLGVGLSLRYCVCLALFFVLIPISFYLFFTVSIIEGGK